MATIIHVAQDAIRANAKDGGLRPAIIVRRKGKPERHNEVEIAGPDGSVVARFVYSPHKPLPCGARLWLELGEGYDAQPRAV